MRHAPFLKMYAEYTTNFPKAMEVVDDLKKKSSRFKAVVDEVEGTKECKGLYLTSHMGTLVNRIGRYKLFFQRILKTLPEDAADLEDAAAALAKISDAASHCDKAGAKLDGFKKVMEIQQSLGGTIDLVGPTREFIKEGKITKISARSQDHQERYLFLVSQNEDCAHKPEKNPPLFLCKKKNCTCKQEFLAMLLPIPLFFKRRDTCVFIFRGFFYSISV